MLRIGLPWELIFLLHKYASYGCLAALCLHVLMHARYLAGVVRKLPAMEKKELRAALCRFGAGAAVSVALYLAISLCLPGNDRTALELPSVPAVGSQEALTGGIPSALESNEESQRESQPLKNTCKGCDAPAVADSAAYPVRIARRGGCRRNGRRRSMPACTIPK